jgi:hypothetical protein
MLYATTYEGIEYIYIVVKENNGAEGCAPKGTYLCAYKLSSDNVLNITCDEESIQVYTKVE